ncbi:MULTISPECIES: hypothetical protein [Haloferacaceae]|uniref:Uncharacterized protein n=2 Tax=Haloferacaceae TaxID=1644056 RepID=A0ABD6DDS4_9EURY|nr:MULTISPECIES: hypothetical protein [Halorubraceae]
MPLFDLIAESLSQPGVEAFSIFALMAGAATLAEFDRLKAHTLALGWTIVPLAWGGLLLTETGSLGLAFVGAASLWFLPGLGFVLPVLLLLLIPIQVYYRASQPA